MKKLTAILAGLALSFGAAQAADLGADVHLTRIAPDKWQVDVTLAEPVDALELDPDARDYRFKAWHLRSKDVRLDEDGGRTVLRAQGKGRLRAYSVDVDEYLGLPEKSYTAFERFSDGGAAVYTGFFGGTAIQGSARRALAVHARGTGLAGDHVLMPASAGQAMPSYMYFGPAQPVAFAGATLIAEPNTPPWLFDMLRETTAKITAVYAQAFARRPSPLPLVMVALGDTGTPGLSVKGGAVGNEVVYRWGGRQLLQDSPKARRAMSWLVAHELAHVWQMDVRQGGIGDDTAPWVYEGGAEAIALAALERSGLYTAQDAADAGAKLAAECATLQGKVDTYRGYYACGFERFAELHVDVLSLWHDLIARSEDTGVPYSEPMVRAVAVAVAQPH